MLLLRSLGEVSGWRVVVERTGTRAALMTMVALRRRPGDALLRRNAHPRRAGVVPVYIVTASVAVLIGHLIIAAPGIGLLPLGGEAAHPPSLGSGQPSVWPGLAPRLRFGAQQAEQEEHQHGDDGKDEDQRHLPRPVAGGVRPIPVDVIVGADGVGSRSAAGSSPGPRCHVLAMLRCVLRPALAQQMRRTERIVMFLLLLIPSASPGASCPLANIIPLQLVGYSSRQN